MKIESASLELYGDTIVHGGGDCTQCRKVTYFREICGYLRSFVSVHASFVHHHRSENGAEK